jgi:hypothetical protein
MPLLVTRFVEFAFSGIIKMHLIAMIIQNDRVIGEYDLIRTWKEAGLV